MEELGAEEAKRVLMPFTSIIAPVMAMLGISLSKKTKPSASFKGEGILKAALKRDANVVNITVNSNQKDSSKLSMKTMDVDSATRGTLLGMTQLEGSLFSSDSKLSSHPSTVVEEDVPLTSLWHKKKSEKRNRV